MRNKRAKQIGSIAEARTVGQPPKVTKSLKRVLKKAYTRTGSIPA